MRPITRPSKIMVDDRGYALVTVAIVGALAFLLAAVIFGRNMSDFNQVGHDRRREQAIHAADGGIDHAMFKIDQNPEWNNDVPQTVTFASTSEERTWAMDRANALGSFTTSPEGEWAVVKPDNKQVVYGVGYIPSRAAPRNIRVIRADYDFAPFQPDYAILTGGDLLMNGSVLVTGSQGNVHANKDVEIDGLVTIDGYATASGELTLDGNPDIAGGWQDNVPLVPIPNINPRENYALSQFDLCPGAITKAGPSYPDVNGTTPPNANPNATPCGGDLLTTGTEFRGWTHSGSEWAYTGSTAFDGVYYVYAGNVRIAGSPGEVGAPWNVTILAEGVATGPEPIHCPHTNGDIIVSGSPKMRRHDGGSPLLLVAGRDLKVAGTPGSEYHGVLAAHEQAQVGGNANIIGVLVSNSNCDTDASPIQETGVETDGNPTITYDGGLDIPFGQTIRITRWLEL